MTTRNVDPHGETIGDAAADGGTVTLTDPGAAARPVADDDKLIGAQLAHFRIDALLGRGGMGQVYKATDLALDRPVAIKLLASHISADPKLRQRFFREARSQARVQHANVCHIYYIGEQDEQLFFAMEYIDGESLQDRLDREGKLDPVEAVELCHMAACGLREAHAHGFTHRDIKPSNLMIDRHGVVKVVDFGLVKESADSEAATASAAVSMESTSIVGTPLYMAPEQAKGERVDFRADVYALGATLHHLVSGQPPFVGPTPMAVVSKHLTEPRPQLEADKRARRGAAPIDALCDRMMAKSASDRFAGYDELLAAMERISVARTQPAGFWVRAFALCLDALAVLLLSLPLRALVSWDNVTFTVVAAAYAIVGHGRWGTTLGKAALEIELVSTKDHRPPGYYAAAARHVLQWGLLHITVGAGLYAQVTWHSSRLADVITGLAIGLAALAVPVEGALASWLTPHKRTLWDRWTNTMVRYRRKS